LGQFDIIVYLFNVFIAIKTIQLQTQGEPIGTLYFEQCVSADADALLLDRRLVVCSMPIDNRIYKYIDLSPPINQPYKILPPEKLIRVATCNDVLSATQSQ